MSRSSQGRLLFLDGLRGLAAFYVVMHHALLQVTMSYPRAAVSNTFLFATKWLLFGQVGVDIFIVLSGFCLMLPVARGDGYLRGGIIQFAKRRAWRILPPYYAAVALSLLLIWTAPSLSHPGNALWSQSLPAFSLPVLLSHLTLVHNLSDAWSHKIDYPLWSVATEAQIYVAFALLLLPLCRRHGVTATIAAAFVIAYIPRVIFHHQLDGACLHFLGLFAFGMCAAVIAFSKTASHGALAKKPIWGGICALTSLLFVLLAVSRSKWLLDHYTVHDVLIGIATATMLLLATRYALGLTPTTRLVPGVVQVLEARPVVAIGKFSYSLYLTHAPILAIVFSAVSLLHRSAAVTFLLCEIVGIPICIGAAYIFHLAFERPFMPRTASRAASHAGLAGSVPPS